MALAIQMNANKMTRSDYVTRLLTGGKAQELGRCVSEGQNTCLGISIGVPLLGAGENCCGEECLGVDIVLILQAAVAALDLLLYLGLISAPIAGTITTIQAVIAALQAQE